jgi:hypothetical protein
MKVFIRSICLLLWLSFLEGTAQNAPRSIAGSEVCLADTAIVPVYALDFNNILSCDLKFSYDTTITMATGVVPAPGMGGMISTNLTVPGQVNFGWFTAGGISLPDSAIIFYLQFSKTGNGISTIHWIDNGPSCEYYDGNFQPLNDAPSSEYYLDGTLIFQSPEGPVITASELTAVAGIPLSIPVYVSNFNLIGSFSLNLQFDPEILSFDSYNNASGYPGMEISSSQSGSIQVSGIVPAGDTAVTLVDDSALCILNFNYLGGSSALYWVDDGPSCQFAGSTPVYPVLNDIPQSNHYINGMVTESYLPAGAGPITGPSQVCQDDSPVSYFIDEINYASGYVWEVTEGAQIVSGQNTNSIQIIFNPGVFSGIVSVYGTNSSGNGNPSTLEVSTIDFPEPAGSIYGDWDVCPEQNQLIYTVDPVLYATTYNWFLPEGAVITSGMNSNTIEVIYGANSSSGYISVFGANQCGAGETSAPRWVSVGTPPEIEEEPISPPAVPEGDGNAVFFLEADGTEISYQWEEFNGTWNTLIESDTYFGVNSDTLTIINPVVEMNGNHYRCVVNGTCNPAATTNGNALLTVISPVNTQSGYQRTITLTCTNPFNDDITLIADFPDEGHLIVRLLDLSGQPTLSPIDFKIKAGRQSLRINAEGLQDGIYILSLILQTDSNLVPVTRKLVCSHHSK